jgi:hypothetical protein
VTRSIFTPAFTSDPDNVSTLSERESLAAIDCLLKLEHDTRPSAVTLDHSWRSAILGSTLIALRVGMIIANRATVATVIATRMKVLGSDGLT